jgi:CubicO group peptidase (beta-lactamase class C family)
VTSHLPAFQPLDPEISKSATIVDILCHATGIQEHPCLYLGNGGTLLWHNDQEMFEIINASPTEPGDFRRMWRYNALLYSLLSLIIEKQSGHSFADFLRLRIFEPLGMTDSSVIMKSCCSGGNGEVAVPYTYACNGELRETAVVEYGDSHLAASCGVQSSVRDMLIWAKAVMSAATPGIDNQVEQVLKEIPFILTPICPLPSTPGGKPSYALGWFHMHGQYINEEVFSVATSAPSSSNPPSNTNPETNRSIYYHSGLIPGFGSSIHLFPTAQSAIVVLENASGGGDTYDWVSRYLSAVICGDNPPSDLEEKAMLDTIDSHFAWKQLHTDLTLNRSPASQPARHPRQVIGAYRSLRFGLTISISIGSSEGYTTSNSTSELDASESLRVSFHPDASHAMALSHFYDDLYSFFPSEQEYREETMCQFSSWAQFLLHFHLPSEDDSGHATGLWWQFEPTLDGTWFALL